jgi:hypothetical protein
MKDGCCCCRRSGEPSGCCGASGGPFDGDPSAPKFITLQKESRTILKDGLLSAHAALRTSFISGAALTASSLADVDARSELHVSTSGDVLISFSEIANNGLEFAVVLSGVVGPIPVQLSVRGRLDVDARAVEIGMKLLKPFETKEYVWKYALEGMKPLGGGGFAVANVRLDVGNTLPLQTGNIDYWCILRCGALGILPILLKCLPAFSLGPQAYVACVVADAGGAAAGIAACVAEKCL